MSRVTVDDIAKAVGVTKGLVSRALTGKYNVSEEMRDTITRKAAELGYDFTKLRTKSKKRSKCLLIMSSVMMLKEDYWQPIIKAITTTLDTASINLEYFIYDESKLGESEISKFKTIDASGYVIMHNNPELLLQVAQATNRPVVVIDPKKVRTGKQLQIKFSNFDSFYDLTKLLISMGHRHICFYGSRTWSTSFSEREQGFLTCVEDNADKGVHSYEVLFRNADQQYADNDKFEHMLRTHPQITAIMCANDIVALNAKKSIERIGKCVPEDISLVGFDNIRGSQRSDIDLTTVNVPRTELGVEAAKYLVNHISSKQITYTQIVVDCEIIVRGSIQKVQGEHND